MGNMICSTPDAAHLATIARDICPFPSYEPSPLLFNMLSVNSSQHLAEHYAAVQASLTAQQLEGFTQSLRSTVGGKGKVTHGSVGVIALSLALLFDTLAGKMKGQWVPEEGPIPGLFVKHPRGQQLPSINTASEYLRLVPYIANNPTKMREEAERYLRQMLTERMAYRKAFSDKAKNPENAPSDITMLNLFVSNQVIYGLHNYLIRLTNESVVAEIVTPILSGPIEKIKDMLGGMFLLDNSFNCDAGAASKEFVAKIHTSGDEALKAFDSCKKSLDTVTWLDHIAFLSMFDVINSKRVYENENVEGIKMEDFDLKGNALGKW